VRDAHLGAKGFRVTWLKDDVHLFTAGFGKKSERQMSFWDIRKLNASINTTDIDISPGFLLPFYDPDTGVVFLAGKGDSNIKYYEIDPDTMARGVHIFTNKI
jgi:hypothetical protein